MVDWIHYQYLFPGDFIVQDGGYDFNLRGEGNEEVYRADNGCCRDNSFSFGVGVWLQEGRVVIESYPDAYAYVDCYIHSYIVRSCVSPYI